MSLTYATYQDALSTLTAIPTTDTNFIAILPDVIDYAEGRIYRELDMVVANMADATSSTAANTRSFTLPTSVGTFLVVTGINIITPAETAPESGTRNPLTPVSREFLDMVWPSTTGATLPQYFNLNTFSTAVSQQQILFGPWPDAAYRVEVVGKIQPAPLSATNTTTYLTNNLSDLFLMASMIFFTGAYMKNFGSMADDPKSAQSYESQYQVLKASADTWQARARFSGASWTPKQLEQTAQPQRG